MPRYKVVKGRVSTRPGDIVETTEDRARKYGARLEEVAAPRDTGPKTKKKAVPKKKPTAKKAEFHVQPEVKAEPDGAEKSEGLSDDDTDRPEG